MEYSTPEEYANLIKYQNFEYSGEPDDLSVRLTAIDKQYLQEIETLKKIKNRAPFSEINTKYADVVEMLKNDFYSTLSDHVRTKFDNFFHFTTVDNRCMNASIKRSPDKRFYSVFINSSLITLLHRYGKLEFAMLRPKDVVFCSRFPDRSPTRSELVEMFAEMHCYYTSTKMANGPFILIDGISLSSHCIRLDIQEKLLMYHEIGHFLNGDLFDNASEQQPTPFFENNLSYQREYLADLTGFGLYLRELKHNNALSTANRHLALYALISLYMMQHGLQGIETERYPHPLNRMCVVINHYYGPAILDLVDTAIKENQMEIIAPDQLPEIDSSEEQFLSKIERDLQNIFEEAEKDIS